MGSCAWEHDISILNVLLIYFVIPTPLNCSTYCEYVHTYRKLFYFFSEKRITTLAKIYYFVQLVETRLAWTTHKQFNQKSFWQWMSKCYTNVTVINRLCVSNYNWYLIMIFCLIAHHFCMALPFIMCSIVKQCWNIGYKSLLTLSFIIHMNT